MSILFVIAAVVFFAAVIVSQKMAVKGLSQLDDATKLRMAEVFPKRNANNSIIVFAVAAIFLIAVYALPQFAFAFGIAYGALFFIYIFVKMFLNTRKLREINAPESYVRTIYLSFAAFIGGAFVALALFAYGMMSYR